MLRAQQLPPPTPATGLTQPGLLRIREGGFVIIHAAAHWILSENVLAVIVNEIGSTPTWVRLDQLDSSPLMLDDALGHQMWPDQHHSAAPADSFATPAVDGATAGIRRALVLEDVRGGRVATKLMTVLESLLLGASNGAPTTVLVCHARLPAYLLPRDATVVTAADLHIDMETLRPALEGMAERMTSASISRLARLGAARPAVFHDILSACRGPRHREVAAAIETCTLGRQLAGRVTDRLITTCTSDEIRALHTALDLGYWQDSFDTGVAGSGLAPWLVPLEAGWFWLRPTWRYPLRRALRRRRWWANVRRHRPAAAMPPTQIHANSSPDPNASDPIEAEVRDDATPASPAAAATSNGGQVVSAKLFGRFEVAVNDHPVVTWEGHVGPMVLKYVLAQPDCHAHRDVIMDVLWPDADPLTARNRLYVAVSALRRGLRTVSPDPIVVYREGGYEVLGCCDVDVNDFRTLRAVGHHHEELGDHVSALREFRRATNLYRGPFLSEYPYVEWTIRLREQLRDAFLDVLFHVASILERLHRTDECINVAHVLLDEEPTAEAAHRLLMRSYARQGRMERAVRQYELCRETLADTLEVSPSDETTREYLQIRKGRLPHGPHDT